MTSEVACAAVTLGGSDASADETACLAVKTAADSSVAACEYRAAVAAREGTRVVFGSSTEASVVGGDGIDVGAGAEVELADGSEVQFARVESVGRLRHREGSAASFDADREESCTAIDTADETNCAAVDITGSDTDADQAACEAVTTSGSAVACVYAAGPSIIGGDGMVLDRESSAEFSGGVDVSSRFDSNGTVSVRPGAQLRSTGRVAFGANGELRLGSGDRRQLQSDTATADVVVEGDGLESYGHITVPAGGSLTFQADDESIIAGQGLDSSGSVSVWAGTVQVNAGGVRSDGALEVMAGALNFDSDDKSEIGGSFVINDGASVSVSKGAIELTCLPEGLDNVDAGDAVSISFMPGSGVDSCPEELADCIIVVGKTSGAKAVPATSLPLLLVGLAGLLNMYG